MGWKTHSAMRRVGAILLGVAAVLACVAVPTAAQATATHSYTVDCSSPGTNGGAYGVFPGESVEITSMSSCAGGVTKNGAAATLPITVTYDELDFSPQGTISNTANVTLTFSPNPSNHGLDFNILFFKAGPDVTSLAPLQLASSPTMSFPGSPTDLLTLPGTPPNVMYLAGMTGCSIEVGPHPYATAQINVPVAGLTTMRVVGTTPATSPVDDYVFATSNVQPILRDTFLALYSSFDPAHPSDNVVACNDDAGGITYINDRDILNSFWSLVNPSLAAGNYTLVLMTYVTYSDSSWNSAVSGATTSAQVQVWQTAPAALAATGVSSEMERPFWLGLSAVALGVIALTLIALSRRRRRS